MSLRIEFHNPGWQFGVLLGTVVAVLTYACW